MFLEYASHNQQYIEIGDLDRSGSCAIVVIIVDGMCYTANTGDSRAVMSAEGGQQVFDLSEDHKPSEDRE